MRVQITNNLLIVRKRFFETSVVYLLPLLLLPFINEYHYQYIYLYLVLALFYVWLYVCEIKYPVLFLNNRILMFRQFSKHSYFKGFLTYKGMAHNLTTLPLKNITKVDFNYPMISLFLDGDEQFEIALKISKDDFRLVKSEFKTKVQKGEKPYIF